MGSNEGIDPQSSEEEVPLVVSVDGSGAPSAVVRTTPRNHTRDLHILSFAFLFVFSAYGAAQNLESTVNNVCSLSLSRLYFVF